MIQTSAGEAHERWEYDETTQTQRLKRIVCMCSFCHDVTHYGLACVRERDELALRHLMYVNVAHERPAQAVAVECARDAFERRLSTRGAMSPIPHRLAGACRASWKVRVKPVGRVVMITSTAPLGVTT